MNIKRLKQILKYSPIRNIPKLFFLELIGKESVVKIKLGTQKLSIRSCSPDLTIAYQCLKRNEYSIPEDCNLMEPKWIVDLGANIGASTLYFSRTFPSAKIVALEPEQNNFKLLVENTSHYQQVHQLKRAIWNVNEERDVLDRGTGQWGYTVCKTIDHSIINGQKVKCITLDSLIEELNIPVIDILKIDIEGCEKALFDNPGKWIDKVNVILVELHDRIVPECSTSFRNAVKGKFNVSEYGENHFAIRKQK